MNGYNDYDPRGRYRDDPYSTRDDYYGKRINDVRKEDPYGSRLPPGGYGPSNGYDAYSRGAQRERDMPPPRDGRNTYEMDHLATFTVGHQQGLVSPDDGMRKLRQMEMTTGIWTMRCDLVIQSRDLVIVDKQSGEEMERFALSLIKEPTAMINPERRDVYNNIVLFTVMEDHYKRSPTEMHIFQSIYKRADDVVMDIKDAIGGHGPRGGAAESHRPYQHEQLESYVYDSGPYGYGDRDRDRDRGPEYDRRERHERHERHGEQRGVSNQIQKYEDFARRNARATEEYRHPPRTGPSMLRDTFHRDETESVFSERTDKDVQLLNHCFDDIEKFVERLQQAAEAFKELDRRRRGRNGRGGPAHGDGMLSMRSRPPPAKDFIDIFQKFKLSFNLLAKLRTHIHDPNAPELVHFLFTPLSLIVEASKDPVNSTPDLAQKVVAPLLTPDALDLLHNCLTTKERELLRSLGDPWNVSADRWKGYVPPYVPRFYDGWQPSPSMMDAATGGGASRIATDVAERARDRHYMQEQEHDRMYKREQDHYERERREYNGPSRYDDGRNGRTDDTGNFTMYRPDEDPYSRRPPADSDPHHGYSRDPPPREPSEPRDPQQGFLSQLKSSGSRAVQVKHPRQAKNDKELTVQIGEYLEVLDDSKNWYKLRNIRGEVGHAPYTILDQVR